MGAIMEFLMKYYLYFLAVLVLLILALVGYLVDTTKTNKLKREFNKQYEEDNALEIPISKIDGNIRLGESVNASVNKNNEDVNQIENTTDNNNSGVIQGNEPPVQIAQTNSQTEIYPPEL